MELGETEAFGVLDHHHRRGGHVDAHLDDRGRDQQVDGPFGEGGHRRVFFGTRHPAVNHADASTEDAVQVSVPVLRGGHVEDLGFLDQRTDPVDLGAARQSPPDGGDNVLQAVEGNHPGIHRSPPGRFFGQPGDVHVAIRREQQRARDRRRRHHQHVRGPALGRQGQPLMHTEAVLFVDDRQRQILERDRFLEQRVGSDDHRGFPVGESLQDLFAGLPLFPAGEQCQRYPGGRRQRPDGGEMLTGEDLGRRHQRGLGAAFDGVEHGQHGDDRLAAADIALKQPQHALVGRHVVGDLGHRALL